MVENSVCIADKVKGLSFYWRSNGEQSGTHTGSN